MAIVVHLFTDMFVMNCENESQFTVGSHQHDAAELIVILSPPPSAIGKAKLKLSRLTVLQLPIRRHTRPLSVCQLKTSSA